MIKFNQSAWLKPHTDTDLTKKARTKDFEKDFFKLLNNAVFVKTMENVRKQRDIKLVTTERRRNYLVAVSIEMKKSETLMNKPVYLGLSLLELMCEFWSDYTKPKHGEKAKLCYIDTNSFIVYIKTDHDYKGTAEDVETIFGTLNYESDRPLPNGKNKKVIGLMKDELGGNIVTKFIVT